MSGRAFARRRLRERAVDEAPALDSVEFADAERLQETLRDVLEILRDRGFSLMLTLSFCDVVISTIGDSLLQQSPTPAAREKNRAVLLAIIDRIRLEIAAWPEEVPIGRPM